MPQPLKDFSNPATVSVQIDVSALAKKHGVDAGELESIMQEYICFAEKEHIDNRTRRKRYQDIEDALTEAQEYLVKLGIKYQGVRFIGLITLVQHKHDMLPDSDPLLVNIELLLMKAHRKLQTSNLHYLEDGGDDILSIMEQVQNARAGMRAGKSGSKATYNRILVMQLAMIHPKPRNNTWTKSGPFFGFCRDVFIQLKGDISVSSLSHLIERYVKVKQKSK